VRTGRHANSSLVVLFLSLGGLAFAVLQSLVAPALPVIAHHLKASTEDISWVLTAYLLAASVFTPILGRLGDMVGKRKVLIVVLAVLAAGTLLAAVSTTLTVLIVARVLQGAAGAIFPLAIGIVRDELPRERVGVTVGMLSAIFGIGGGLGIVLSGPIVDHFSWQWLFWFPLVLVVIGLLGAIFGVPESPVRTPGRLDVIGALILSASLVALLLAVSNGSTWGWGDGKTLGLLAVGAVLMVVFVLAELRVKEPLINMRLIALRGVWTTNLVGLTFGFAMYGSFLLIPSLLELPAATGYGFGKSVTTAGLFLLPSTVMMMVFGPISGLLERKYGPKLPLVLGAIFETAAFVLPAIAHGSGWLLLVSGALSGIGLGFAFAAMSNAIIESVPAANTGEATSVNTIVRSVGGSVGSAAVAAVLTSKITAQGVPTDAGFTAGFWLAGGVAFLAFLASLALPAAKRRHDQAATADVADLPAQPEESRPRA
jgi:EmrB/QacA subfamily drug resistance transporter